MKRIWTFTFVCNAAIAAVALRIWAHHAAGHDQSNVHWAAFGSGIAVVNLAVCLLMMILEE